MVDKLARGLGGSLEAFHFGLGEDDAVIVIDVPDDVSAAAISLTVRAAGAVSLRVTSLLAPEELDRASKTSVRYRAPGG